MPNLLEEFNYEDPVYVQNVTDARNWAEEIFESMNMDALNAYANAPHDMVVKIDTAYDLLWSLGVVIGHPETISDTYTSNPEVYNVGKLAQIARILSSAPLQSELYHNSSNVDEPVFKKPRDVILTVRFIVNLKLINDETGIQDMSLDDIHDVNDFLHCVFEILRNHKYTDLLLLIYSVNYIQ